MYTFPSLCIPYSLCYGAGEFRLEKVLFCLTFRKNKIKETKTKFI